MTKAAGSKAPRPDEDDGVLLSIGDLADATGIGPDTIRAWERRYGRPEAVRLPSGHRRYTEDDVRWLRRVAEALALGHRPSKVVHLSDRALDDLLEPAPTSARTSKTVARQLDLLRHYKTSELRRLLLKDADTLGPRDFLRDRVAPLLVAVGRSWADGDVSIRHEHTLTEVVADVLRVLRERIATPTRGPLVVLATLEGERHELGLQMVAIVCALAGVQAHLLGCDTPIQEIVQTAVEAAADAVALSVSLATGGIQTDRLLADLRRRLPEGVTLVVGGAGARGVRRGPRGVAYIADWDELDQWLADLGAPSGRRA